MKRCLLKLLAGAVASGLVYTRAVRPRITVWGATPEEVDAPMPLDERVPAPRLISTRAITIEATPAEIWPWLAQIGEPPRAGYYSYTFIERLIGLDVVNQERILPEFQQLAVGDALDRAGNMRVLAVAPEHHLVLGPPKEVSEVRATWAFLLAPIDGRSTRLITRVRGDWTYGDMLRATPPLTWPLYLLVEPGIFVMEQKMLREIKRLAERFAASGAGRAAG